ncbi:MAG: hydantoinase/oxoprolinase family protein, partial [Alphaproteobacteria bacterium]|nr:hydantoinase/oxoprolinase family protein [Alphaproteobacteria bacterium]
DANLLRGALNPGFFLGGRMQLDFAAAQRAIETRLASAMGCDAQTAAAGVVRLVNARITDAIRVEAAKKGIDLAGHTLVPFGGAGPLHAAQVAEDLGMPRVLVPRNPGAFSALGLLCSDVRHDYMRSELAPLASLDATHAEDCFRTLEEMAQAEFEHEGLGQNEHHFIRALDLRYAGQGYELRVVLEAGAAPLTAAWLPQIAEQFNREHEAVHGHAARDAAIEIVSYRLRAIAPMPKYTPDPAPADRQLARPMPAGTRRLMLAPDRVFDAKVWRRSDLAAGWRGSGPCIVEQEDATTVVPDGWLVRADEWDNLVLEKA